MAIQQYKEMEKKAEQAKRIKELYNKRLKIAFFIMACFAVFSMFMCSNHGCSTRPGEIWLGCLLGSMACISWYLHVWLLSNK